MSGLIRSWLESGNDPDSDFPLNNLPYGVFSIGGDAPRCCTIVGDRIVDLAAIERMGFFDLPRKNVFAQPTLNAFMALGPDIWANTRDIMTKMLRAKTDHSLFNAAADHSNAFFDATIAQMHMPFEVAGYTDFYAGKHHATNVGTMFRGPENALPPNWLHMPIGYNGRASTVVVSGTDIVRPHGQLKNPDEEVPRFGPSQRLDIEIEMGAVVGSPSEMGKPVSVAQADAMIFGYVLLNDWSARDIQAWEYQPLGPFQGKAFATSISPWVVSKTALEPFRVSTPKREKELLPYLREPSPMLYDIDLQAELMPPGADNATVISRTNYREMYYSAAQQLAHHASSGCAMNTGDLLGSGTISGTEQNSCGSLLEITWGGKEPLTLNGGETRTFLEDGDTIALSGHARGDGFRVGFGTCEGKIHVR